MMVSSKMDQHPQTINTLHNISISQYTNLSQVMLLNMFATSLPVCHLNAQLRIFKRQNTFIAFIDQQNPETLYS
jgi:hypothetical protein